MQVAASNIRAAALRKMPPGTDYEEWSPSKKKKIKDNFLSFCDIVLAYTQYESSNIKQQELRHKNNSSPLDSGVSTAESYTSDAALSSSGYPYTDEECIPQDHQEAAENLTASKGNAPPKEDDSYESITCFCRKPYAGRPMIECSVCLTWLHLTCAKVRRTNIPKVFICEPCRNSHTDKPVRRKQQRKSGGGRRSIMSPGNKFKSPSGNQGFAGGSSPRYSRTSPVSSESSHNSDNSPCEQYSSTSPEGSDNSSNT